MRFWIGFSDNNTNEDTVEYKDTTDPIHAEEYAYNLWTHLSAGNFEGYVIIETNYGSILPIWCGESTFELPEDWEDRLGH